MDPRLENVLKIAKALDAKDKDNDRTANKRMPVKDTVSKLRDSVVNSRLRVTTKKQDIEKKSSWYIEAQQGLDKSALDLKDMASKTGDRLGEYWESLEPSTKNMLINTMLGTAAGGAIGATAGATLADPGQGLSQAVRTGASGALLGGAAAGAGHAGYNALFGGRRMSGETKGKDISDRMSQAVIGSAMKNPLLTTGTLAGGAISAKEIKDLLVMKDKDGKMVQTALDRLLAARNGTSLRQLASSVGELGWSAPKLLGLPLGVLGGYMGDKYIRGDYD